MLAASILVSAATLNLPQQVSLAQIVTRADARRFDLGLGRYA
jgi:hypothetical protein